VTAMAAIETWVSADYLTGAADLVSAIFVGRSRKFRNRFNLGCRFDLVAAVGIWRPLDKSM